MCKIIKRPPLGSMQEYCEDYFEKYNASNNYRKAWLAVRKKRYEEIRNRNNNFFLNKGANKFKKEVLQFWELGYSYRNSKIKKGNEEWIFFQNQNGETPNSAKIIENLDDLELHGNYSWSKLSMGVYYGDITDNMQRLQQIIKYLIAENINKKERFKRFNNVVSNDNNNEHRIIGMGHGKASMFLHIKYPDKYGVWNSCTDVAFKILSKTKDGKKFKVRETNIGGKYKIINEQLKWLLKNCKKKNENSNYVFENLSDVDIFVWYVANYFLLPKNKKR